MIFFFNDTATTEIYTLSLHDALPIWRAWSASPSGPPRRRAPTSPARPAGAAPGGPAGARRAGRRRRGWSTRRSEEHTSELQSRQYLVCRLLLEKKKLLSIPHASLPCS